MSTDPLSKPFRPKLREPCFCGSGKSFKNCCGRRAANRKPPSGVILLPGWLSTERCDALSAHAETSPRSWLGTTATLGPGEERASLQRDPSRVTQSVAMGEQQSTLDDCLRAIMLDVVEPRMNCKIEWFTSAQVLRYQPGGYYLRHADSYNLDYENQVWHRFCDRDISLLMYLNQDFEGGNITFINFNYSYKPRKGDLLLFPSDHRYMHQAEPVTAGTRYAVVSWATVRGGPRVLPSPPENAVFL